MKWWEKKDEEAEVKLPKEIQEQLDQVKEVKTQVDSMSTKLSKLDSIDEWIAEQRAERTRQQEAANKPKPKTMTTEEREEHQAEIQALFLAGNIDEAYAKMSIGTNAAVALALAQNVKREVFEDDADKYPYYTGEIKAKINELISAQTLEFQRNPAAIKNAYYTVVGQHMTEIQEGKIKDRFASSTSTRSTKVSEEDDKTKITPNDDIRKIARQLGMKEEDYVKLLEEDAERYV